MWDRTHLLILICLKPAEIRSHRSTILKIKVHQRQPACMTQAGCSFDAFGFQRGNRIFARWCFGGSGGLEPGRQVRHHQSSPTPPSNLSSSSDLQYPAAGGSGTCRLFGSCFLVVEDRGLEWIRATYDKRHTAGAGVAGGRHMQNPAEPSCRL